jgi:hypothetical protein
MKSPFNLDALEADNKTSQQVRELFKDTEFLHDCAQARANLKQVMRQVEQLQPKITSGKDIDDILKLAEQRVSERHHMDVGASVRKLSEKKDKKSQMAFNRLTAEVEAEAMQEVQRFDAEYLQKKEELASSPAVFEAVWALADKHGKRFKFSPTWGWRYTITMFLLFEERTTPWRIDVPPDVFAALHAEDHGDNALNKLNFEIKVIEHPITGKPELYIQILDTTASKDVAIGWRFVEAAQRVVLGKKRFYPKKNLGLSEQVFELDRKMGKGFGSDWEKRDIIFGESGEAFTPKSAAKESKERKKIKQTRYSYKRRFDSKS